MQRRAALLVLVVVTIATAPIIKGASSPVIVGTIGGVELCPQDICGESAFSGSFSGLVNGKPASGVFWTGVTYVSPLPTTAGNSTQNRLPFHHAGSPCYFDPIDRKKYKRCPSCFPEDCYPDAQE